MPLFQRISDTFWSYVSPSKRVSPGPRIVQEPIHFKKPAIPTRKSSIQDAVKHSRSMTPNERVDSWRLGSSSEAGRSESVTSSGRRKRRRSPSTGGRRKKNKLSSSNDMQYGPEEDFEGDTIIIGADVSDHLSEADASSVADDWGSEIWHEDTLVVPEEEYKVKGHKKRINIKQEQEARHVSTNELKEAGWDDDHIMLVQKITMRGYEPLFPSHWKMDFRFLPNELFDKKFGDGFINSISDKDFRATKALQALIDLGPTVRDRVYLRSAFEPQDQIEKAIRSYMKWAVEDAELDMRTAIPLIAIEAAPASTPSGEMHAAIRSKFEAITQRYRAALRIHRSVEASPSSHTTELYSQTLPTLYGFITSHTLAALVAYSPMRDGGELKTVAMFDFGDKPYDVWNSLALAITVCHCRNVAAAIADDTGLGNKQREDEPEDDPDA